jgi:hypothetical protein
MRKALMIPLFGAFSGAEAPGLSDSPKEIPGKLFKAAFP